MIKDMVDDDDESEQKKKLYEYIDVLHDAVLQRNNSDSIEKAMREAECVHDIYDILKKHNVKKSAEIVRILCMTMTLPILMLETNVTKRTKYMVHMAIKVISEILGTIEIDREQIKKDPQMSAELDQLRKLTKEAWGI
jgi:hypothetical protein